MTETILMRDIKLVYLYSVQRNFTHAVIGLYMKYSIVLYYLYCMYFTVYRTLLYCSVQCYTVVPSRYCTVW